MRWAISRLLQFLRGRRAASTPWTLEHGNEVGDDVGIDPRVLNRGYGSQDFVLLEPHEIDPFEGGRWPRVPGDRIVWAVGDGPKDCLAVALVVSPRAGDAALLPEIAAALAVERPDIPIGPPDSPADN